MENDFTSEPTPNVGSNGMVIGALVLGAIALFLAIVALIVGSLAGNSVWNPPSTKTKNQTVSANGGTVTINDPIVRIIYNLTGGPAAGGGSSTDVTVKISSGRGGEVFSIKNSMINGTSDGSSPVMRISGHGSDVVVLNKGDTAHCCVTGKTTYVTISGGDAPGIRSHL